MRPETANAVVDILREWGVSAHVARVNPYQHGIRVVIDRATEALWDTDGASGLEAQILGNGVLVGLVPTIKGVDDHKPARDIAAIIARTDYGVGPN